jgi:hypothetical protein
MGTDVIVSRGDDALALSPQVLRSDVADFLAKQVADRSYLGKTPVLIG